MTVPLRQLTCRASPRLISCLVMIDTSSQVPSPGAAAWLVDLREQCDTRFVVMRLDEGQARRALTAHLLSIGAVPSAEDAVELVRAGTTESEAVVW